MENKSPKNEALNNKKKPKFKIVHDTRTKDSGGHPLTKLDRVLSWGIARNK